MICLSHGGTAMSVSSCPSETLFVGTVNGVLAIQRENEEGSWRIGMTGLEGRHISSLVFEPVSGLLFAGVHKAGLYRSKDLGKSWERKAAGLTQEHIYCLSYVQRQRAVELYAGTEPAHLFRSDDLGETWHELQALRSLPSVSDWTFPAPPHVAHVKTMAFDPSEPRRFYVGIEQAGLFRTKDGGESWDELYGIDEDVHRIVIRPSDPKTLYLATGNGVYLSRDGGDRWKHIVPRTMRIGYPDPLLICPFREDLMFMAGAIYPPEVWHKTHEADSRIARSEDAGMTWKMLNGGLPDYIHGNVAAMSMEVVNGRFLLFAGTTDGDVFYSDDEGEQWTKIVSSLPPISKGGHHILLGK